MKGCDAQEHGIQHPGAARSGPSAPPTGRISVASTTNPAARNPASAGVEPEEQSRQQRGQVDGEGDEPCRRSGSRTRRGPTRSFSWARMATISPRRLRRATRRRIAGEDREADRGRDHEARRHDMEDVSPPGCSPRATGPRKTEADWPMVPMPHEAQHAALLVLAGPRARRIPLPQRRAPEPGEAQEEGRDQRHRERRHRRDQGGWHRRRRRASSVKTSRPPTTVGERVMPAGRRATAPSRTGTATSSAVWVPLRWKRRGSRTARRRRTRPQAARHTPKDTVMRA